MAEFSFDTRRAIPCVDCAKIVVIPEEIDIATLSIGMVQLPGHEGHNLATLAILSVGNLRTFGSYSEYEVEE